MSALAQYLKAQGYAVAGYDRIPSSITALLAGMDVEISFEDAIQVLAPAYLDPKHTLVVYTPAIPKDSVLLHYFTANGYTLVKRAAPVGCGHPTNFLLRCSRYPRKNNYF